MRSQWLNIKFNKCKIVLKDSSIDEIGVEHHFVAKNIGKKVSIVYFEIDIKSLSNIEKLPLKYKQVSKYPSIEVDLNFISDKFDVIDSTIKEINSPLVSSVKVIDIYDGEDGRAITTRITFSCLERTLTREEVQEVVDKVVENLAKKGVKQKQFFLISVSKIGNMKNKELNLFNRLFKIVLTISFLFCVSCSSKKYKVADFCEDVFIPGNKYYETNVKHQEGFEIPPVLKAKDILPPSMLGNKLYTIKDEVYSDGTIDHFYLKSKWGDSKAESFLILKTRINEVNALESLDKLERVPFFKGLGKSALAVITSPCKLVKLIGKMFTASPKETTEEKNEPGEPEGSNS